MEPVLNIFLMTVLILVVGCIGILSGFGIMSSLVPILVLFIPLPQALLFVGIIHWFNNVWRLFLFRAGIDVKLLVQFGIPGIVTSFLGATLVLITPTHIVLRLLGLFLCFYALLIIFNPKVKLQKNYKTAIAGGTASGFAAGIFGMGGMVRSVFLTIFDLPKEVYMATGAAIGFFIDSVRVMRYLAGNVRLEGFFSWGLLIIIPLSFVGAWLTKFVVDAIPQRYYRRVVAVVFLGVGIKLLLYP